MTYLIEDVGIFRTLYDSTKDVYELVDILIEAGIITKESLLEKFDVEIEEYAEELTPFIE